MKKRQTGLTAISWMVVLAYLALQGILALRIIPVYLNYNTLQSIMDNLAVDPDVQGKGAKYISQVFRKRLKMNNLYDLSASKDAFKFKKIDKGFNLSIKYEERGPIFKNLNFVADFKYEVNITTR
ncbi:MAG: DUF4845 domain-containing protein [Gammaproteobacteria bacterium]|nr:DUF4845 domain-containing protein [Gammaproteobacteria bacterium]